MKSTRHFILLIVLLAMLLPLQPVRADMAPPPAPLLTGLEPFEYANTKVQMVYERVEMELQDIQKTDSEYPTRRLAVKASFVMHNQGALPESMQSIFPLESLSTCMYDKGIERQYTSYSNYQIDPDSFVITVDGESVSFHKVITPHPYKDTQQYCEEMSWVGFEITFPVDTDVLVTINYNMDGSADTMQLFDYVLETGAGWYGAIERAYVIVKFPYTVTTENILSETTAGYQALYNEIFWSFQGLEPTAKDNIHIAMVTPYAWKSILSLRRQLKENSKNPEIWKTLIETYQGIATWHGNNVRNIYYYNLIEPTYQQAIALNPNNARLHGMYADFLYNNCCFAIIGEIKDSDLNKMLPQINLALALDPDDVYASQVLKLLQTQREDLTFTPPPTIPLTATPLISETPTATPPDTNTPLPSSTPQIMEVTVVQTVIVTATPANTAAPSPTPLPSATPAPVTVPAQGDASVWWGWPLLVLVGFAGGVLVMQRKKKSTS